MAPVWSQRRLFSFTVSQSQVKMNVRRAVHNNVKVKDQQAMFLFPPGVPTALLVLALLFFAAAAGLAVCYVKRWSCRNIIYLVTFVASLSCVFPNLLLVFWWSKWRWQFSYTANFLPHLTSTCYHTVFPTISAHAYQPAFKYRLLAVHLKINKRLTSRRKSICFI